NHFKAHQLHIRLRHEDVARRNFVEFGRDKLDMTRKMAGTWPVHSAICKLQRLFLGSFDGPSGTRKQKVMNKIARKYSASWMQKYATALGPSMQASHLTCACRELIENEHEFCGFTFRSCLPVET